MTHYYRFLNLFFKDSLSMKNLVKNKLPIFWPKKFELIKNFLKKRPLCKKIF